MLRVYHQDHPKSQHICNSRVSPPHMAMRQPGITPKYGNSYLHTRVNGVYLQFGSRRHPHNAGCKNTRDVGLYYVLYSICIYYVYYVFVLLCNSICSWIPSVRPQSCLCVDPAAACPCLSSLLTPRDVPSPATTGKPKHSIA